MKAGVQKEASVLALSPKQKYIKLWVFKMVFKGFVGRNEYLEL